MTLRVDEDRDRFAQELFTPLPGRYEHLAEILSFGQNARWRTAMVDRIVPGAPARVLDVACGTAAVSRRLARRTGGQVVGVDLTEGMLREGMRTVAHDGLRRQIHLVTGRAQSLPFGDGTFDALTFTYLLRYVDDPQATLDELARVVRPGGVMASLEFLAPPRPFWRASWWLYTRLVLPAGGWVLGGAGWYRVGRFLGPNISGHYRRYPVEWTVDAWRRAGMTDVGVRVMSLGGGLVMWGRRAGG
jgi:demethylmenaquinone methyltransferase/2-methoxy-6-polyprenyl-1,4-benzoquinol methylase